MPLVDAQVHCFAANSPQRPWKGPGGSLREADGATTVALMDANGVGHAVLVSPSLHYGDDASYAFEVAETFPGRFRVVVPVGLEREHPEAVLAESIGRAHFAGLRYTMWTPQQRAAFTSLRLDPLWRALSRDAIPLCVATRGEYAEIEDVAERFPGMTILIDHLGLPNSPHPPAPERAFALLGSLMRLAAHPNVSVKATGMPALSSEPHPHPDVHDALHRTIGAFGPDRVLWGTDWTRVHEFADYTAGVHWIDHAGLTAEERRLICGQNAVRVFGEPNVR